MSVGRNKNGVIYFATRYTDPYGKVHMKKVQNAKWKTLKEAKEAEKKFLESQNRSDGMKFETLLDIYLQHKQLTTRESTLMSYERLIRLYAADFLQMPVNRINEEIVERWQAEMLKSNHKDGTVRVSQAVFLSIMNFAYDRGYTDKKLRIKRAKRQKALTEDPNKVITKEQLEAILEHCDEELRFLVVLLYWTGLRIGEALPLSYNDISCGTIKVNRLYDLNTKQIKPYTKTGKSREVIVPNIVLYELDKYKKYKQSTGLYSDDLRLFDGYQALYGNRYAAVCKSLSIEPHNIHSLRHTHVSLLISLGFSPFEIAERTGHSAQMIFQVYGHNIESPQVRMVKSLDKIS